MPNYKDGTPAEVGDFVKGKPYNTDHEIVGTLVEVTEGQDTCNCTVAFVEPKITTLRMEGFLSAGLPVPVMVRRPVGGRIPVDPKPEQRKLEDVLILPRCDTGDVRVFTKIG